MGEYRWLRFPADAIHIDAELLGRLPESSRRVFATLREQGPLTHADLRDQTGMPPRTIRYAVGRLKEEGLVDCRGSLQDSRSRYFFIHLDWVGKEALEKARQA